MPTQVGQLLALLKLDSSDYTRGMDEASAKADKLSAKRPTVKVSADVGTAIAKLEAVRAAQLRVAASQTRFNEAVGKFGPESARAQSAEASLINATLAAQRASAKAKDSIDAEGDSHKRAAFLIGSHKVGLATWAALATSAAIPAAVGLSAAFAGLGGVLGGGLLAFIGIKREMKQGSELGQAYSKAFQPVISEFTALTQLAATETLTGINKAVQESRRYFPALASAVAALSKDFGDIVGNVGPGLVALLVKLAPLAESVGTKIVAASGGFATWAQHTPAIANFAAAAQKELPIVASTLGDVAKAIGKIVVAAGPLGGVTLTAISGIARAISSMPIGLLQVLVPLIIGFKLALRGFDIARDIAGGLRSVAGGFKAIKGALSEGGGIGLGPMAGVLTIIGTVGAIAAAAVHLFGHHAHDAVKPVEELTDAIKEDSNALGTNTRKWIIHTLTQNDDYNAALKLGISQKTLTDALMGNRAAVNQVAAAINKHANTTGEASKASNKLANDLPNVTQQLNASKNAADNEAAAMDGLSASARQVKHRLDAIPANKKLTITLADNASSQIAKVKANIAALNDKQIDIYTYIHNVILPTVRTYSGSHDSGHAAGGLIRGPGSGTSDSILARVSAGEFIMSAAATKQFLPLLQKMNASVPAFAGGGLAQPTTGQTVVYAPVNVTVEGSVRSDKDLATVLVREIDQRRRWRGDVGILDSWSGQKALQTSPVTAKDTNTPGLM
jgi:hypothetical protein